MSRREIHRPPSAVVESFSARVTPAYDPRPEFRRVSLAGVFWSGAQQLGERGVRWAVYLVLARIIAPESFGIVALSAAIIEVLQVLLNQGLPTAIVQRQDLQPAHLDSAFWIYVAGSIPLTIGCIAAADPIARAFHSPELAPVLRWFALALPLGALDNVQDAVFRRRLAFRPLALRAAAGQVCGAALALALGIGGAGVWSLVALALVPPGVGTTILWAVSPWRPRFRFSVARYRELLGFGIFGMGLHAVGLIQRRADYLLIGAMLGPLALGLYAMARQILTVVTGFTESAIGPVAWSTLCRLQGDPERLDRAARAIAAHQALVVMPVSLGIAVTAPVLIPALLGDRWDASVPVTQALGCLAAVTALSGVNGSAILATGAVRWRTVLELVRVTVSVGALLLGARWGITGVGWALVVGAVVLLPLQLGAARVLIPLRIGPYLRQLAVPVAGSAVMVAAIVGLRVGLADRLTTVPLLGIMVGGGAIVYAGAVWLAGPALVREGLRSVAMALQVAERSDPPP